MLKITVSGMPGEGKTTLACTIQHLLSGQCIDSTVTDPDVAPPELHEMASCLNRIRDIVKRNNVIIPIVMEQVRAGRTIHITESEQIAQLKQQVTQLKADLYDAEHSRE